MYKISISWLKDVINKINPQTLSKIKLARLSKWVIVIQNNITIEAPVNTGLLRNIAKSYATTIGNDKAKIESKQIYASAVEMWSRPHMPPVGSASDPFSLASWARKKNLNPRAVAMGIKKKGTRANPFMKRASENSWEKLEKLFISELQKNI